MDWSPQINYHMMPWTHLISPNLAVSRRRICICLHFRGGYSRTSAQRTSCAVLGNYWAGSGVQAVERDPLVAYPVIDIRDGTSSRYDQMHIP